MTLIFCWVNTAFIYSKVDHETQLRHSEIFICQPTQFKTLFSSNWLDQISKVFSSSKVTILKRKGLKVYIFKTIHAQASISTLIRTNNQLDRWWESKINQYRPFRVKTWGIWDITTLSQIGHKSCFKWLNGWFGLNASVIPGDNIPWGVATNAP